MRKAIGFLFAAASAIVIFIIFSQVAASVYGPSSPGVQAMVQDGADQVAKDAVAQYQIAARSGHAMDRCVQAGFVTAAFLQAKNEERYKNWKGIEDRDCAAAGIPVQ